MPDAPLTHLEYERVLYLVDHGMAFADAKAQAQHEILQAFNIGAGAIAPSEQLDISQTGDGNGVLLAISVVVQSNKSEAQLTELLSTIGGDLREDGLLNGSAAPATLVAGMEFIKPQLAAIRSNIAARFAALGVYATIPAFEAYAVDLDTVPPTLVSSTPANGETTFVREVVVTFSDLLNHSTLNTATIRLVDSDNQPVPGTLSATDFAGKTTALFKCAGLLAAGVHHLLIGTGVQDYATNGVPAGTSIDVTHALPTINVTTNPVAGVTTFIDHVTATFADLMDHATLNTTNIRLLDSSDQPVPGTIDATDADGKTTVTFTPAGLLLPGAYRLMIGLGVRDATGRDFASGVVVGFTHELLTMNVTSNPTEGATTFVLNPTATFSTLMYHATLNTTNIRLLDSSDQEMPGAVSAKDTDGKTTVTFRPASLLLPGAYRLMIGLGVRDVMGRDFANAVTVGFTHELLVMNVTTNPGDGATTFVLHPTATFSTLMDHATFNTTTLRLLDSSDQEMPGTVSTTDVDGKTTATFEPASLLLPGTYRLMIGLGVRDALGRDFANDVVVSFTHERLTMNVATNPADGATTFVYPVVASFSTLMDHATLDTTNIRLVDSSDQPVAGTVSATDADGRTTATFKPASLLLPGTYRLMIGLGVRDALGRDFAAAVNAGFTHQLPVEVLIPAGPFQMGCGGWYCDPAESPLHTVTLDAYSVDQHEVTNAQYGACVAAGVCSAPISNRSSKVLNYFGSAAYANFPVVYVDWQRADTFCRWADKRLPTEAEWEKAARGSSDTRYFPWGTRLPDCTFANFYNALVSPTGLCVGDTTAVGSYPGGASPYGVLDMAGNVSEWVNDWYLRDYYFELPPKS